MNQKYPKVLKTSGLLPSSKDGEVGGIGSLVIFLDPLKDNIKPHVQLNWINKFSGITLQSLSDYRKEHGPGREKKLEQINLRKAIEARKSKSTIANGPGTSSATAGPSRPTRNIVILPTVPDAQRERKVRVPKSKRAKGQQRECSSIPKVSEKPPTPKKVQQALGRKTMNANFKIPKKPKFGALNEGQQEEEDDHGDLDNVVVVDPLASILPAMEKPPVINPIRPEEGNEGWGNETPRSPRTPGYESPTLSTLRTSGGNCDNPFDNDDFYEGEADF